MYIAVDCWIALKRVVTSKDSSPLDLFEPAERG